MFLSESEWNSRLRVLHPGVHFLSASKHRHRYRLSFHREIVLSTCSGYRVHSSLLEGEQRAFKDISAHSPAIGRPIFGPQQCLCTSTYTNMVEVSDVAWTECNSMARSFPVVPTQTPSLIRFRLIPIASIITPATLSIQSAPLDIITATEVPNLDFGSFDFLAEMPTWAYPNHYSYAGPHTDVLTVTNSVLSGGSILAMEPPGANSSWVVEFLGPSLKCEKVNETMEDRLLGNYIDAHFLRQADGGPLCYSPSYGYYAWSPRFNFSGPSDLPFLGGRNASLLSLNFAGGTLADSQVLDAVAAPALYIMTFPGYSNQWGWDGCQWNNTQPSRHYEGTILQCHLYNSTYRTAFNYTDGNQSITVEISKREDEPQSSIIWGMSTPFHYHGQPFVWCPDRDTWNESSGRWTHAKHPLYTGTKFHAPDCELCGSFNRKLLQGLSYQAVFDAFSSTLKGVAPNIPGDNSYPAWRSYPRSKVMETQLVQNKDLNFLRTSRSTRVADENLQQYVSTLNDTNVMGVLKQKSEISDRPLGEEIERMFKDVTVSLMSSKHLR